MPSFPTMLVTKQKKEDLSFKAIKTSTPVVVSKAIRDSIAVKFKSKRYREAYVQSTIANHLAHQIRINRENRGLSQEQLAQKIGVKAQSSVARLEDPSYGKHSIATLAKLASAFDVALVIKFVSFSSFLIETCDKSPEALTTASFEDEDLTLQQAAITIAEVWQPVVDNLKFYKENLRVSANKYSVTSFQGSFFSNQIIDTENLNELTQF